MEIIGNIPCLQSPSNQRVKKAINERVTGILSNANSRRHLPYVTYARKPFIIESDLGWRLWKGYYDTTVVVK